MKPPRLVLGIHDGHNCTAALVRDGVLIGAISEERLTRKKNESGYPCQAINRLLANAGITAKDLDRIAISSRFMHSREHLETKELWYRVGEAEQRIDQQKSNVYREKLFNVRREERLAEVRDHLGVAEEDVSFVEHHLSHAAAAYFGSPYPLDEKVLVLTCDGAGDGLSATVSVAQNGKLERIAETSRHDSLGKIYSRVTYLMGMRPWEHEYKIMGLAPYADENGVERSLEVFRELLGFSSDGLCFERKTPLSMNYIYSHLRDRLENHRFDWIAGAVQRFTEEMLSTWVANSIQETGIHRIACGGGVFMNIKANMLLRRSSAISDIFVFPSCGDESNAIGAALLESRDGGGPVAGKNPHTVSDLYLGDAYEDGDVKAALENMSIHECCTVTRVENINQHVGRELALGHVVARFSGRMEWGARSLGNRSILGDASRRENVTRINDMIKMRDFWMPFAPSILYERAGDYLADWDGEDLRFMIMGYESTPLATKDLPAAMHPYDRTIRPQLVRKEENPGYWEVLKTYEQETGRGGVLNTSFNLHGFPIVNTPAEALDVFLSSGLERIALENYYVEKRV